MASVQNEPDSRLRARFIRRWHLGLIGILTTVVLCVSAALVIPVSYTATADVILTPPPTTGQNANPNPYLALGDLQPLAEVVARAMTDGPAQVKLRASGLINPYTVATDQTTNSPLVIVTATGATEPAALTNLRLILATAPTVLTQLQDAQSVPTVARVKVQVISLPTRAKAVRKSQIRAVAVALVVGLVGTTLVVTAIDVILLRRRSRGGTQPHPAVAREVDPDLPPTPDQVTPDAPSGVTADAPPRIAGLTDHPPVNGVAAKPDRVRVGNRVTARNRVSARNRQSSGTNESRK